MAITNLRWFNGKHFFLFQNNWDGLPILSWVQRIFNLFESLCGSFFFKLPIEDLCSLTSQSLPIAQTSVVPESTEDILLKGFTSLGMEEERIETAQQVSGSFYF